MKEGRQHGGLILLLSPRIRHLVCSHDVSKHHLSVGLKISHSFTLTVTGVYLPPSLSDDQVQMVLGSVPVSQVIVGDINTRYGASFQDSASGPPGRRGSLTSSLQEDTWFTSSRLMERLEWIMPSWHPT